jgi:hypothetical protein
MDMQLFTAALLIADVVKLFNPQSPQARAIFDLTIVVIAVMVVIFAVVVGIARQTAGLPDSFLLATGAPQFLGISFLTAAQQKNSNETATKGGLNRMKSRVGRRDHLVAATCAQSAAVRREGKAKM